jgi:hypothetical protein
MFTGPNQLKIAANLIPLVYFVHIVFFPIAYPISLILDCWLGHDEGITVYNRKEIATMMNIQHEEVNEIIITSHRTAPHRIINPSDRIKMIWKCCAVFYMKYINFDQYVLLHLEQQHSMINFLIFISMATFCFCHNGNYVIFQYFKESFLICCERNTSITTCPVLVTS